MLNARMIGTMGSIVAFALVFASLAIGANEMRSDRMINHEVSRLD